MIFETDILIHSVGALFYITLLLVVIRKRGLRSSLSRGLNIFLLIYFLMEAGLALKFAGYSLLDFLPDPAVLFWVGYGIFLGAIVMRHLGVLVARRTVQLWRGDLVGVVWFLLVVGINFIPFSNEILFVVWGWEIYPGTAVLTCLLLGWLLFVGLTMRLIAESYQTARFPTIRNRLFILGLGYGFLLIGNILSFMGQEHLGTIVSVLGILEIAYVVLIPRLPHLGVAFRRVINSVIYVLLEFCSYVLSFLGIQFLLENLFDVQMIVVGAVLALLIMFLVNPLLRRLQKWMDRLFFGEEQDTGAILREYSQNISNILDLELLSAVAVDMVRDMFGVDSGLLFLVELEMGRTGEKQFRIQQGRKRKDASLTGIMPAESMLAQVWDKERRALTQAEIDMIPRYQSIKADTRQWLSRLNMDVYVPIHAQDEWVGLLALGPKASGASYFSEDIDLLSTLADQTAVALQNARLVESLLRVNTEFQRAYAAMEDAHTKLQRIDRTKSDFISIASHELRTPLTVLSGYSQMLLDAPDLKDNPIYADALEGVVDGAQRLHEIVDSMLDIAKIDMHELSLQSVSVQLEPVVSQVCRRFAKAFHERKLKVIIDKNISELPPINGDPDALKKVFDHLLSNAVKYTPDEGMITISGRRLQEGYLKFPQGGVEITIKDSGIGIDPRYIDLVFTKFYQTGDIALHSSGKTKFKGGGPGLGLAIVRGIVVAHGGRVWAESQGCDEHTNPGSTFYVILPLSQPKQGQTNKEGYSHD